MYLVGKNPIMFKVSEMEKMVQCRQKSQKIIVMQSFPVLQFKVSDSDFKSGRLSVIKHVQYCLDNGFLITYLN